VYGGGWEGLRYTVIALVALTRGTPSERVVWPWPVLAMGGLAVSPLALSHAMRAHCQHMPSAHGSTPVILFQGSTP
jgi:hypothetical protein